MLIRPMMFLGAGGAAALRPQDVFATSLYTGNSSNPRSIVNGIDLAGKGGLTWFKNRNDTLSHRLFDTSRGANNFLDSSSAAGATSGTNVSFNSDGVTINTSGDNGTNTSGYTMVNWSFRRAPKFFDIVPYTGSDGSGRKILHSLGIKPGLILVKRLSSAVDWAVYHRSIAANSVLTLNSTAASSPGIQFWANTEPTSTDFTVDINIGVNTSGQTYVAYLFAHDPDPAGIIQCGSYVEPSSGSTQVTLGWQPQFLIIKGSGPSSAGWYIFDSTRGFSQYLLPNSNSAEASQSNNFTPNSTGFAVSSGWDGANSNHIYLAIRGTT